MSSPPPSPPPSTPPPAPDEEAFIITVVHCWSAPRSRSTALLYSFESRGEDTIALDEPLYRRWLQKKTASAAAGNNDAISRPYTSNLCEGSAPEECDEGEKWRWEREAKSFNERIDGAVETLLRQGGENEEGGEGGVIFVKQMAKFSPLFDFDANWEKDEPRCDSGRGDGGAIKSWEDTAQYWKDLTLTTIEELNQGDMKIEIRHRHLLLIRDPVSVLGSWMGKSGDVHGNNPRPDEVGVVPLLDVYSKAIVDGTVTVVDSDDLAADPEVCLKELCATLGIEYRDSMLQWKAGPHDCDGPWAEWWYHDVRGSTGWDPADEVRGGNDEASEKEAGKNSGDSSDGGDETMTDGNADCNDNDGTDERPKKKKKTPNYRTVPPALLPSLRMSLPAYDFLRTLTPTYSRRAVSAPPSGKLYEDPRNEHVLVYVGAPGPKGRGRILPRDMAGISPFDSSVQGGDAAWEGIRVYQGRIFHLERHLTRLFHSAKALGFECVHTRDEVREAVFRVLAANGMRDGAHMRLTLTRGEKCTSSMNPRFNVYGTTLIILPEWKPTEGATTYDNSNGVSLITAGVCRRNSPNGVDSKIHHNNMINNILPKMQANLCGAADAIMLDPEGYVSETNATNIFLVDDAGTLVTPTADYCLPGITRETILLLAKEMNIITDVRRVSLAEFHYADEVFTTGTMGELTPVTMIDGRVIGTGKLGKTTARLQDAYKESVRTRLDWSTKIP